MKALTQAVRRTLQSAGLWQADARLLCGVSGGCDSVTLLHALCALREEMPFALYVSHVQHGLRGEDSIADEAFVRGLCLRLEVPLLAEHAGLAGSMHTPGMETLAREKRRAIFQRQMESHRIDALLLAHHRDDQAETVLMHLLRGAGMEGLCGMKPAVPFGRGWLLRPFLEIPRREIEAAGFPCREDGSNQEALTPRNALRLDLLPRLEALFPGASAHIASAAEALAADERHLADEADALYLRAVYDVPPLMMLKKSELLSAPGALVRRVLRRFFAEGLALCGLSPQERSLSRQDTLALAELLRKPSGACLNLPCGLAAHCGRAYLYLLHQSGEPLRQKTDYELPIAPGQRVYSLPHLCITQTAADALPASAEEAVLSPAILALSPVLRAPRPGDRIHPFGAPGSKPLRRFLTDRGIDLPLRPALSVLAAGDQILWIPSLCTAEALRVSAVPADSLRLSGAHPFMPHRT